MARLALHVLGTLQVTLSGTPFTDFESDKERALLAFLAEESEQPHRREKLVGLLESVLGSLTGCPETVRARTARRRGRHHRVQAYRVDVKPKLACIQVAMACLSWMASALLASHKMTTKSSAKRE